MTNSISPISSVTSGATASAASALSSTVGLVSSFKDILSAMTGISASPSLGQTSFSSMSDTMTSLMMLLLLEKLVDGGIFSNEAATNEETATRPTVQHEPLGRPVGGFISQEFHPGHNGIDFGVIVGTPVQATMDGKVVYAGWNAQGYGNLVIVENGEYKTYYAHLSSIPVSVGDAVAAGTTIGISGNTGNSTGPHLHYEIRRNNKAIDPTSLTFGRS